MDANGLRQWPLLDRGALGLEGASAFDVALEPGALPVLRLARRQAAPETVEDLDAARTEALRPAPVCDARGGLAWWDGSAGGLRAAGFAPDVGSRPLPPEVPEGVARPDDLALGEDDVLHVARNGAVVLVDLRDRWPAARAAAEGFAARRLAPAPGGGVWALDRAEGRLARLTGTPLRPGGVDPRPQEERFEPEEPNPNPPRLTVLPRARVPEGREATDLACSAGGRVAVLARRGIGDAELLLLEDGRLERRFDLEGLRRPVSLAWIGEDRVAVIAFDGTAPAAQAYVYEVDAAPSAGGAARPLGAVHRLLRPWQGQFCKAPGPRPRYLKGEAGAEAPEGVQVLRPLSQARYARQGGTRARVLDSGLDGCTWHRLRFDADAREGTGAVLWAFAGEDATPPPPPGAPGAPDWAPHRLGAVEAPAQAPTAARLDPASDPEHRETALACGAPHEVLLQRAGARVRRLTGRFLHLHLELRGDGRSTPRLGALRVSAARFSWRDRYLPAFMGETLSGPDGAAVGPATPADFLERLLALFEGPMTAMEDRIAAAWLLTDPHAAPDAALPWLAQWVGIEPQPGEPARRLRERLKAAPWTARLHGTAAGVLAALELSTGGRVATGAAPASGEDPPDPGALALARRGPDAVKALALGRPDPLGAGDAAFLAGGGVTGGEIVLVEGWRLRRTFATLLGVDLRDRDDPLTLGGMPSGNSFVGDTLFLGSVWANALLRRLTDERRWDRDRARRFLDQLAHRALVLVREEAEGLEAARLAEIAQAEAPAHVLVETVAVTAPLLVAVSSLVGVDTYLVNPPARRTARLRRTRLGRGDVVAGSGALDPRADGPLPRRPEAALDGPAEAPLGADFVLSAERSRAFGGRRIARNIFMWD